MIAKKLCDRRGVVVVDQQRRLLRWTGINDDVDLRAVRRQRCPIFDLLQRLHVSDALEFWRLINVRVRRRLQIMFAKRRHRKFARLLPIQMLGLSRARQLLTVDLALQFHEGVEQRLWPRWTTGNVNINRYVTIDSFQHVVTLLEWPA